MDFAASMAMASRYYQKYEKAYPGFSSAALQQAEKAYAQLQEMYPVCILTETAL